MTFLEQCIEDSLPIWETCLQGNFLQQLAKGTLSEESFKGYIVEDSLYLREYSKVFAWGIINSENIEEIGNYYSMLAFVNEGEGSTRKYYLKRYGLTDEQIQGLPLRGENEAYVKTMIEAAKDGQAAECMMATLPCMISYQWIFTELLKRYPQVKATVYDRFVSDYESEEYREVCERWIEFTEEVCQTLSVEEKNKCMSIFHACSKHELQFWKMSEQPRRDV